MSLESSQQIQGTLLGLAWGDVFGCPVEGWSAAHIRQIYGNYERLPDEYPLRLIEELDPKRLRRLRPLGLHSDDTQQALALLNVCLSPAGWSPEAWAELLVEGQRQNAWRGYGSNFASAVAKLSRGESPRRSGSPSAGIGAAMRIAPLGALYRDDPERLARVAFESSLVTHGNLRAASFAYAIAFAASALIAGEEPADIKARLPDVVARRETEWLEGHADWEIDRGDAHVASQCLREFFADPPDDPDAIGERVSAVAGSHLAEGFTRAHPNQGFVMLGGLHGLALALTNEENPAAVLAHVVRHGYDTDTVAAIAGALLGARWGTDWFPRHRLLEAESLQGYAEALVARNYHPENPHALVRREAAWTRREDEYQASLVSRKRG